MRLEASSAKRVETLPLFRPEALTARREQAFGSLLLVQPISTRVLTVASLAVAASLVAIAFKGEYTRKARVAGFLVPTQGLIKVYARDVGTIVEKHVEEGQRVRQGDALFVVSMERRSREATESQAVAIARLRERRASVRADLAQQERIASLAVETLQQTIDSKQFELDRIGQELTTQQQQVANARNLASRYQQLLARSLASEEMVQEKQAVLLDQEGKLHALEREQVGLTGQLESLRAQLADSKLKATTQRSAIERDISSLDQTLTEYESRLTFVVTAPAGGTATAVLANPGQTTNPSQPLASILPQGSALLAHLLVPSDSIGFVAVGQTVALRYQAFPYQRFGSYQGRVSEVARTLILPGETALPTALTEPAYRVTVTLDTQSVKAYGQDFPLQSGMLLDASIWLDRRKLYQWLLDPLYSVLGRV